MKLGRNDPCSCGSGKKYKQCCLKKEQLTSQDQFLWRRIRRAIEGSPMRMLDFSAAYFGKPALLEAWDEFMPWEDEPFTFDTPHITIFMPWFFYEWKPDPRRSSVRHEAIDGRTPGRAYLDYEGCRIDPLLASYIEQCCLSPFSFYDVISVQSGEGILLRDIFTGEEILVTEKSASQQSRPGDILFAKVVTVDGVSLLEANAPYIFPPMEKGALLALRKKMERSKQPLTPERLRKYGPDMLGIYHDIVDRLLNPPMPQLQNTDGDPLLPYRLVYQIESPRAAFDALKSLCLTDTEEELLAEAGFDAKGDLREIEFPWQRLGNKKNGSWCNTVLGYIRINKSRMEIEINSENRAQKIRGLVEKMLPSAHYKTTVIESLQAMLARVEGETPAVRRRREEADELNSHPEVQAHLDEYLRQHYRSWPEEKLPALGGKTPLQAVKTRDGREMVEALLTDIERRGENSTPPLPEGIIGELRNRLGL